MGGYRLQEEEEEVAKTDLLYGADHLSFPQRKKIKKCDQERLSLQWEIRTFSSPFRSSIFGPMWENICFEITVGESPLLPSLSQYLVSGWRKCMQWGVREEEKRKEKMEEKASLLFWNWPVQSSRQISNARSIFLFFYFLKTGAKWKVSLLSLQLHKGKHKGCKGEKISFRFRHAFLPFSSSREIEI